MKQDFFVLIFSDFYKIKLSYKLILSSYSSLIGKKKLKEKEKKNIFFWEMGSSSTSFWSLHFKGKKRIAEFAAISFLIHSLKVNYSICTCASMQLFLQYISLNCYMMMRTKQQRDIFGTQFFTNFDINCQRSLI